MPQFDRLFLQLRRSLLYALAIIVVTAAVVLSIARIFLPEVQGYREAIEQRLGELIEQNVRIEQVDARLVGFTPTIIFKGVRLIDDSGVKELIAFDEAQMGIAVFQSLAQRMLVPSDFTIVGTAISVIQGKDGAISVQGFDISQLESAGIDSKISEELSAWLFEQASLSIKDSVVVWKEKDKKNWHRFQNVNAVLHNRAERHQLTASFEIPEAKGKKSTIAMDVRGDLTAPEKWQGLVYVSSQGNRFSRFGIRPELKGLKVRDGIADYTLWGEWAEGGFVHLSGDVAAYGVDIVNTQNGKVSRIDSLKGKFDWQGNIADWTLRVDDFEFKVEGSTWNRASLLAGWKAQDKQGTELHLGLSYAKIEDVRNLLIDTGLYSGEEMKQLTGLSPAGEVRNLHVSFRQRPGQKETYSLAAELKNIHTRPWKKIPGIQGLNARISLDEVDGRIVLDGSKVVMTLPEWLRQPIEFDTLSGDFALHNARTGWVALGKDFSAANTDLKLSLDMLLMVPTKRSSPYLDLQLALRDVNIATIHKYQPAAVMKEKLVAWIDNSFKSGTVPHVNLVFRGWTGDFPFKRPSGVFKGDFTASQVAMDYFPGWPGLTQLEAKGEFTGRHIMVRSDKAVLHNGAIRHLSARIEDFKRPILFVEGDADSTTHDGFHFFAKTPVGVRAQRFVRNTRFGGDIHTHMTFSLALDKALAKKYKKRFSGYIDTRNAAMYLMHEQMDVTDIKGRIYFSNKKYHGEGITAKVLQGETTIRVSSKMAGVKPVMEIAGQGRFDARMLDRRFKKLGLMRISGQLPWEGRLTLGHKSAKGKDYVPAKMWLKSDLVGVTIDLPEPFRKSAEAVRRSTMHLTFLPDIKTILSVQYGDRMSTEMRLNNRFRPARIEIGELKLSAGKARLPDKDEFRISGVVNNLDQYGWRDVMQEHYAKYKLLRTRPIVDVPVIVDFAYVNVPFDKSKAKLRKRYTSPRVLPAFKGQIRRFVFAGKELGKLEFDSRRDKFGLAFDKVRLTSDFIDFNAKGAWHYINDQHQTRLQASFKTPNLGRLVTSFGFPDKVEDGEGGLSVDLNWHYPFYVFQPGFIEGTVQLDFKDGVVKAINPGAGRFLGLLNLSTLPRRLLLDFSDVGSGFGFDSITGNISLHNGVATTSNLAVDSTVADVLAVGRVDLRNKKLDQIVTVTPQVAGTMPVVSGLLIGTGVIPLVWLFERMFGSDMDKSLSRQYHITGPWEKPKVERIDKEKDEDEAASAN